ncbi:hypothetical protein Rhal01_02105 [Rubritalea halochordaticola]|uniref:Uncharacterized protein n=1 Tax=Rubritalea halochordaticola TaxID=714537 RepID=A0ABP9V1Y8_9BACT
MLEKLLQQHSYVSVTHTMNREEFTIHQADSPTRLTTQRVYGKGEAAHLQITQHWLFFTSQQRYAVTPSPEQEHHFTFRKKLLALHTVYEDSSGKASIRAISQYRGQYPTLYKELLPLAEPSHFITLGDKPAGTIFRPQQEKGPKDIPLCLLEPGIDGQEIIHLLMAFTLSTRYTSQRSHGNFA